MKDKQVKIIDSIKLHLNSNRVKAQRLSHIKLYALKYAPLIV